MTALDFQATQSADNCTEGGLRAESANAFSCESQTLFRQATTATTDTSCNHVPSLTIDCGPGTNIKIPEGLNRDVQIHDNGPSDSNSGTSHSDDRHDRPNERYEPSNDRREPGHDRNGPPHDRQPQVDCDRNDPPVKSPRGDYFHDGPSRGGKDPERTPDREDCDRERSSDQRRHHHGDPERHSDHRLQHQREDFHAFMRRMEEMFSRSAFNRYGDHHAHRGYDRQPVMRVSEHEYDRPFDNRHRWSNDNRWNNDRRVQIPEHDFLGRILAGDTSVLVRGFDQSPGRTLSEIKSPISGISADQPLRFLPTPIPGISTQQFLNDAPSPREALNPIKVAEFTVKEPLRGIKNILKGKLF